ncbi:MAG: peptide chain release factor N(5)-glutamine methyltransferase [Candidatus Melainabacteria bacterium]|nr:peptide chain release factor N(5)-glutamine methyltransferase [Candidatus Melainabacteria bacterium]
MSVSLLSRVDDLGFIKREIAARLISFGIEEEEASAEASIMIEHVAHLRPSQQLLSMRVKLSEEQLVRLDTILGARAERVPIQYILEEAYFMGLKLKIKPGVFIPRPDTETLVEVTVKNLKKLFPDKQISLLEIGIGSGAIAISLLTMMRNLEVVAVDVSDQALAISAENAKTHGVDSRLKLIKESQWWTVGRGFHALVSNPPYIPRHQEPTLQLEVAKHEPELALYGTDEDGLGYYRQIGAQIGSVLDLERGFVAVEVGDGQAQDVQSIFQQSGFADIEMHNDLCQIPRVVSGLRQN